MLRDSYFMEIFTLILFYGLQDYSSETAGDRGN